MVAVAPQFVASSYADTSGASSATVTGSVPAGTAVGDTMLALVSTVTATVTTPAGWTLVKSQLRTGTSWFNMYSRVAGSSEPAPVFTVSAATTGHSITVASWRGVDTVGVSDSGAATTATTQTMLPVTVTADKALVVYAFGGVSTGALPAPGPFSWSAGVTKIADNALNYSTARSGTSIAYEERGSFGTTGTVTSTATSFTGGTSARMTVALYPPQTPDTFVAPSFVATSTGNTSSASSTTITAAVPAGTIAGDVMIAAVNTNAATIDTPSGWVYVGQQLRTGSSWLYLFARRATDSEPAPSFTASAAAVTHAITVSTYRNVGGLGDFAGGAGTTAATLTMPTLSVRYGNSAVFSVAYASRASTSVPVTHSWANATERSEDSYTASSNAYAMSTADQVQPSPGPSTAGVDTLTNSVTNSVYMSVVLRPITQLPALIGTEQSGQALTTTGSFAVNLPPETQVGDVVIMSLSFMRSTATASSVTDPAGWTPLLSQNSSDSSNGVRVYAKVFAPGDPTTVAIAAGASAQYGWNGLSYSYRGADFGTMVSGVLGSTTASASHVIPSVTTATSDNILLAIMGFSATAASVTATWPADIDRDAYTQRQAGTSRFIYINSASTAQRYSGQSGARTVTLSSSLGPQAALMLAIPPLLNATLSDSDSASAAEDASTTAVVTQADTATANDQAGLIVVDGAADSATAVESSGIVATEDDADTATATDSASVSAQAYGADTATAVDDAYVSNTIQDTDSATAVDDSGISVDLTDSASASDSASVAAQADVTDSAAALEDTPGIVPDVSPDSATAVDNAGVGFAVTDTASALDTASVSTSTPAADTATAVESATVTIDAEADTATWTEAATRSVSGKLVAPRVYSIEKDDRVYRVPREDRTIVIAHEYREYRIISESLVDNNL